MKKLFVKKYCNSCAKTPKTVRETTLKAIFLSDFLYFRADGYDMYVFYRLVASVCLHGGYPVDHVKP